MKIAKKQPFWPKIAFICFGLMCFPTLVSAACNCPSEESCGPCEGGITQLSLRYDGNSEVNISVSDFWTTYFNSSVDPGETFTFEGKDDDGTFTFNRVYVSINGNYAFSIVVNCSDDIYVNTEFDNNLVVVAGESRDGGSLCCADGEADDTPPEISGCPEDITVELTGSNCSTTVNWTAPEATDDCNVASFTSTHNPGDEFQIGASTVTYTAVDESGNSSTCSFDVNVTDNSNPVINNCPSDIEVFTNANQCGNNVNWTPPEASDNCAINSFQSSHSPGDFFSLGTTEVTYTASDNAGNTVNCSFNITVTDNKAPIFTNCPSDITMDLEEGDCFANVSWNDPDVSDNCNLSNLSSSHEPGEEFPVGTTKVTYTATDIAGNKATCSFNIIINDNNNPVLSNCPENIEVNSDEGKCSAIVQWTEPDVSDNCNFEGVSSNYSPGDEFPMGTTEVIYTAYDSEGNSATCSFEVTVNDSKATVFSSCPDDIEIELTDSFCPQSVEWELPEVSDNCSKVELVSEYEPGDEFEFGITEVTYTATDSAGNSSTCSFNVIIRSNYTTRLNQCPDNIKVISESGDSIAVEWQAPEIIIECHSYTLNSNFNPGDKFGLGTTEVNYSVQGSEGIEETCSFNVVVTDEENFPPEGQDINITLAPGEEIEICIDASDQENDPLIVGEISEGDISGSVSDPDEEDLCFNYQASNDFIGEESIEVKICEDTELNQCVTITVNLKIIDEPGIKVSQVITPDGDGINDLWIIENIESYNNKVMVFDRWGGLIFEAEGYDNENVVWNGLNNNNQSPTGTYFYTIEVKELSLVKRGFIELIK